MSFGVSAIYGSHGSLVILFVKLLILVCLACSIPEMKSLASQGYAQFAAAVVQRVICDWWHTQGQKVVVGWSPMCGWLQWEACIFHQDAQQIYADLSRSCRVRLVVWSL